MECLVLEMLQHRVFGGVASAPGGAPPPRPSLFFCSCGVLPESVRCPGFTIAASSYATAGFNQIRHLPASLDTRNDVVVVVLVVVVVVMLIIENVLCRNIPNDV
jgi:hypothetical protein